MNEHTSARHGLHLALVLVSAMSLPMLVLYSISSLGPFIAHNLAIAPGLLGYIVLASFAVASLLSLIAGNWVKRWGARQSLSLLFFSVATAFSLMAVASTLWGLILAALMCGIAQALANPVTNYLIANNVAVSNKAFFVGLKQSGVQVAALFAGLVLPAVTSLWGWRAAIAVVVPMALALGLTSRHVAPLMSRGSIATPIKAASNWKIQWPNAYLQRLMAIQCCVAIALSGFVTFIPLFATSLHMSKPLAASLIALFGVMGILSRLVLTTLSAKLRDESGLLALLTCAAGLCLLLLLCADTGRLWPIWLAVVGMGLSAVATNAIAMGMLLRTHCFGEVAAASGLLSTAFFGGFAIGPALLGYMINTGLSYSAGWMLFTFLLLCAFTISMELKSKRSGDINAAQ